METAMNKGLDSLSPSCPLGYPHSSHFSDRSTQRADTGSDEKSPGHIHRDSKYGRMVAARDKVRGRCGGVASQVSILHDG